MLRSLAVIVIALVSSGCASRFYIQKDKYLALKRLALVQYGGNTGIQMGTANVPEAQTEIATTNYAIFVEKMNGHPYQVLPMSAVISNATYKSVGKAEFQGFYTAPGLRFLSTSEDAINDAQIGGPLAAKLCEALKVDAVAVLSERWALTPYAMGFKSYASPVIAVVVYDHTGARIFEDDAREDSQEGMATPAGVVSTDVKNLVLNFNQSFRASMASLQQHIAENPSSPPQP
jgi:hypothetical protein